VQMVFWWRPAKMDANFLPKIDPLKCIGCGLCVRYCPREALSLAGGLAVISKPAACDYTGICQELCPTEAVTLIYEIIFK
jgi:thioredoxin reductase (NADPH)